MTEYVRDVKDVSTWLYGLVGRYPGVVSCCIVFGMVGLVRYVR